jgi:DnaJ like chaperone protein
MYLILFFALIGLFVAGGRGFLFGAALGYLLQGVARTTVKRGLTGLQSQFVDSTFALVGAVCKVDGVVTPREIEAAQELFVRLHLSPEQIVQAKAAFNRGKSADFDVDAEVSRFVQAARGSRVLYPMLLRVLVLAVAADGKVDEAEHELLLHIARRLSLSTQEIAQLEALLRAMAAASSGAGGASSGPPPKQKLDDAYTILDVDPDVSDAELKQVYRKLMKENHPDKIAAKGLPDSMRELAEERARDINTAYDLIRKARGIA